MSDNLFTGALDDAFARLKRQDACPGHKWDTKPTRGTYGAGRRKHTMWHTRCTLCGRRATRPTLELLQAEVIGGD